MNLQTAHKISAIQTLLQNDEQLLEFLFSHKHPRLQNSPRKLLKESRSLPFQDQLLIQVAIDIWCEQGGTRFADLLCKGLSKATARSYAYDLIGFSRWLDSQDASWTRKFNQKDLQDWMFNCQEQNLKPRSINRRLASVRMFYRFCYGHQIPHSAGVLYSKGSNRNARRERFI